MDMHAITPVQPGEHASHVTEIPQHYRAKFAGILTDQEIVDRWNDFDLFDLINMIESEAEA